VGSIPQRAASVRGKLSRCSKAQVSGLEGIFAIYKSGLAKTIAFATVIEIENILVCVDKTDAEGDNETPGNIFWVRPSFNAH
jgi:hypothetical protein